MFQNLAKREVHNLGCYRLLTVSAYAMGVVDGKITSLGERPLEDHRNHLILVGESPSIHPVTGALASSVTGVEIIPQTGTARFRVSLIRANSDRANQLVENIRRSEKSDLIAVISWLVTPVRRLFLRSFPEITALLLSDTFMGSLFPIEIELINLPKGWLPRDGWKDNLAVSGQRWSHLYIGDEPLGLVPAKPETPELEYQQASMSLFSDETGLSCFRKPLPLR